MRKTAIAQLTLDCNEGNMPILCAPNNRFPARSEIFPRLQGTDLVLKLLID